MNEKEKIQGFTVKDKSVCIIGCGGLGCNIAVHLTGAGVGRLLLCDFDNICESNLNRQFLYTKEDIGKSKCIIAGERLNAYSDGTQVICEEKKIREPEDMLFAKGCDIIILAVDNADARKFVQQFCTENEIPLVCGGIDGFYGVCYLYVPGASPCPECAGLNEVSEAKHNVSSTAGIIGSLQSAIAVRYLLTGDKSLSGKLIVYDESSFDTLEIVCSNKCDICKNIKSIF